MRMITFDWITFWRKDHPFNPRSWTPEALRNFVKHLGMFVIIGHLVPQIIMAESSGNPLAIGGLMQIQKSTWERHTKEPWSKAFDPALNVKVGKRALQAIANRYGKRATVARICYSYNVGRYCFGPLPSWTKRHPNKIYRSIFNANKRRA